MSFQGINFANQRLLPSDDGRLYQNIFNDGALYGCGITYSGTKLTIAQGHLVIGGRQIEIESAEVLDVNQAVSGFAQIVIAIDLTKTATISTFNQISIEVRYAAAEDGFPTLTQTDINGSGSYYEAQLALLSLGPGGITGIVQDMPQAAFKGAAEGGGLNLHVVGGTTQPTNPAENTVWVSTDTEISGYAFSATEPENPTEGMVWFTTGVSSPAAMNVDKKNTVMLYPTACKQYVDGSWVIRNVAVYLNGAWGTLKTYYFKAGEGQQVAFSKGNSINSSVTVTTSKVSVYRNTAEEHGHGTYWLTTDKHSLAGKTKLVFRAKCTENFSDTTNTWRGRFLVLASRLTSVAAPQDLGITEYASITPTASSTKDYVIDVSHLNGSYSIGWWGCGTVEIYDVYSE